MTAPALPRPPVPSRVARPVSPAAGGRAGRVLRLLIPVLLLAFAAEARAQTPKAAPLGSLLRVETPAGRYVGILLASPADSLVLHSRATDVQFRIPVRDVLYAERSLGRPSRGDLLLKRGLQGGAVGALVGAVLGVYLQAEFGLEPLGLAILVGAEAGV